MPTFEACFRRSSRIQPWYMLLALTRVDNFEYNFACHVRVDLSATLSTVSLGYTFESRCPKNFRIWLSRIVLYLSFVCLVEARFHGNLRYNFPRYFRILLTSIRSRLTFVYSTVWRLRNVANLFPQSMCHHKIFLFPSFRISSKRIQKDCLIWCSSVSRNEA